MKKLNPEKVKQILKEKGVEVSIAEAELILDFMQKLANIVVADYLSKLKS